MNYTRKHATDKFTLSRKIDSPVKYLWTIIQISPAEGMTLYAMEISNKLQI